MKKVIIIASACVLLAIIVAAIFGHRSEGLTIADLGIVSMTNNVTVSRKLSGGNTCTITPTVLTSNQVRLQILITKKFLFRGNQTYWTRVDVKTGKTNQVSIGDNFDVRFVPQLSQ
jgi:hypothetical protein